MDKRLPSDDHRPSPLTDHSAGQSTAPKSVPVRPLAPHRLTGELLQSRPPRRRRMLPLALFLITCVSTFFAGATSWNPIDSRVSLRFVDQVEDQSGAMHQSESGLDWNQGLIYMCCVLAILLMHEMGHFLATVAYRIPASLPYFIPFPISPIGTMGAVIGMEGFKANRRQMFDIGLAGPLAGLLVAVPVLWVGIERLELDGAKSGQMLFDCPLLVRFLIDYLQPEFRHTRSIWLNQLNPYFMAGWVGLLITGLNMMPISQLDGGHVVYTLFGRRAHWIARGFLLFSMVFVVFYEAPMWIVMVILVTLIGTDHPPTSNDNMSLGLFRRVLGIASLSIPILCFPPKGVDVM